VFSFLFNERIEVQKKELEELTREQSRLHELKKNLKQRNERLSQTRETYFKRTLDQYKNDTNDFRSKRECNKDDVLNELKNLWRFKSQQEKEILSIDFSSLNRSLSYKKMCSDQFVMIIFN
jgi:hypothetical protein